jgi:hypothetical protein
MAAPPHAKQDLNGRSTALPDFLQERNEQSNSKQRKRQSVFCAISFNFPQPTKKNS